MPTLNELCKNSQGHTIDVPSPLHGDWMEKLGKQVDEVPCAIIIGPGDNLQWQCTGKQSFDDMAADIYRRLEPYHVPVTTGTPLYKTLVHRNNFHFGASWENREMFACYLVAACEMAVATHSMRLQPTTSPTQRRGRLARLVE